MHDSFDWTVGQGKILLSRRHASTESPRPECPWFYGEERKVKGAAIYEQGEEEQEMWELRREMGAGRGELP